MSNRYLLVPVALEALVVNKADLNATEWSLAPKNYAELDRFASVEPPPFTTGNGQPRTGVTLHWALPDALTRGRRAPDQTLVFPTVPNRWLVVRLAKLFTKAADGTRTARDLAAKAWVIESDFLDDSGTNPYPKSSGSGLTRLGRKRELTDRPAPPSANRLTALGLTDSSGQLIGVADPAFAAYVANIDNVFSYHDSLEDLGSTPQEDVEDIEKEASLSYMVMGWYDPDSADPLNSQAQFSLLQDIDAAGKVIADGKSWQTAEEWLKVMQFFGWSVGDDHDLATAVADASPTPPANPTARDLYPSRILCHGMVYDVTWKGLSRGPAQPFVSGPESPFADLAIATRQQNGENRTTDPGRTDLPQIAFGNSIIDGLAAMFQYLLQLDDSDLDIGTLFQALEYGLVTTYDQPGGRTELDERIHQEWFSSIEGGSWWEISLAPGASSGATTAAITDAQRRALDDLNSAQQTVDRAQRDLQSLQLDLYSRLWRSIRMQKLTSDPPFVSRGTRSTSDFYHLTDVQNAVTTARTTLNSAAPLIGPKRLALEGDRSATPPSFGLLGPDLVLKQNKMPRFWRPSEPVVVVYGGRRSSKHGGDGRFTSDGTLFCRFSGQEVQSVDIDPLDPTKGRLTLAGASVEAADGTLAAGDIFGAISSSLGSLPAPVPKLLAELALLNPVYAPNLAQAPISAATLVKLQEMIWNDFSDITSVAAIHRAAGFSGVRPSPVGIEAWAQPWAPLFLTWRVTWFPSSSDPAFAMDDWTFNGLDFDWVGLGKLDDSAAQVIEGRSILGSVSTSSISKNLADHLSDVEADLLKQIQADPTQAADLNARIQSLRNIGDRLTAELQSGDLMAQPLTGFHDRLIMRDATQYHKPPADTPAGILAALEGGPAIAPVPHRYGSPDGLFNPVRAGHFRLDRLWVVDGFGQVFDPVLERGEDPLSFTPLRGSGLVTVGLTQRTDTQALQLPPRLVQPARLQFRFVDATIPNGAPAHDSDDVTLHAAATPVCGWFLPNHLDHSLAVFDSAGNSLGAVLLSGDPANPLFWEPQVAGPSAVKTPAALANVNPHLHALVQQLFDNVDAGNAFIDLMAAIDSTLWTTEPLGKRGDNTSVLIGRPIAVVRARLLLELGERKATRQLWEGDSRRPQLATDAPFPADTTVVDSAKVPVRLGDVDQRDDGTLGYFAPGPSGSGTSIVYSTFQAVHPDLDFQQPGPVRYVQSASPDTDLKLRVDVPVDLTLLLDPRGSVHARSGILPVKAIQLPARYSKEALEKMNVTFRVGPLLNEITGIRMPLPVNVAGSWSWIARTGVNLTDPALDPVEQIPDPAKQNDPGILAASPQARLSDEPIHIREGYLKLSDAIARQ